MKKNTFRSSPYPSISLTEALERIESVRKNLGKGTYSREAVAHALGYRGLNGAAVRKVAALAHFGLLEREGNSYKYSPLTERILFPVNEKDKREAIIQALLTPILYHSLTERFAGSNVPSMLENILVQQYKINDQFAKTVAKDYLFSMEFAGLLRNGILYSTLEEEELKKVQDRGIPKQDDGGEQPSVLSKKAIKTGHVELPPLPSGIIVSFPEDLAPFASLGKFSEGLVLLEDRAREIRKDVDSVKN